MTSFRHLRSAVALALFAAALGGDGARAVEFQGRTSAWIAPENPKCTCRYKGEHLPLGARRCLQTPEGPRTAECVTEQNVTSWRPSTESCPQAGLDGLKPNLGSGRPTPGRSSG